MKAAAGLQTRPGALTPSLGQRGQRDSIQHAFFCLHSDSGSSTGCLFFSLGSKFPWHLVFGCGQAMPLGAHFSKLPRKDTGVTCQKAQCRFKLGLAFSPGKTKIVPVRTEVHRESCRRFIFIYPLPAFIDQRTTQESQFSPPILWVPGVKDAQAAWKEGLSPQPPRPTPNLFSLVWMVEFFPLG